MSELPPEQVDRQLTERFDELRRVSPAAPFAPAAAVRLRGRRHARRRAAATASAMLALAGLGVGGVVIVTDQASPPAGPPAATDTAPAPPAPPLTEIPEEWLLTGGDLGPGRWQTGWEPERFEGEPFQLWVGVCAAVGPEDFPSVAQRQDLRTITWSNQPEAAADPYNFEWVDQVVDLYAGGGAVAYVDELRNALATCDIRVQVMTEDFAGDQAVLIEESGGAQGAGEESAQEWASLTAVVRVGDAVITLRHHHPEAGRADEERLLELSVRAADRLR